MITFSNMSDYPRKALSGCHGLACNNSKSMGVPKGEGIARIAFSFDHLQGLSLILLWRDSCGGIDVVV